MAGLKVLVLAGGPDRERPVSQVSGAAVAAALREAGHVVRESDVGPDDLSALDGFKAWGGDVIFPALHGRWGEGGPLQEAMDERELRYVGCTAAVAALCMDKGAAKAALHAAGLPTPAWQVVHREAEATGPSALHVDAPCVVKAVDEGSSFGMVICQSASEVATAVKDLLNTYEQVVVERYVAGMEVTVGVIDAADEATAVQTLPAIQIVPAGAYYDYQAKYESNATQYRFDIPLPAATLGEIRRLALEAYQVLGVRHLGRVDFLVDADHRPWILELNTMPGFTSHSLLPMAAAKAGLPLPALVDRLVRLAVR